MGTQMESKETKRGHELSVPFSVLSPAYLFSRMYPYEDLSFVENEKIMHASCLTLKY